MLICLSVLCLRLDWYEVREEKKGSDHRVVLLIPSAHFSWFSKFKALSTCWCYMYEDESVTESFLTMREKTRDVLLNNFSRVQDPLLSLSSSVLSDFPSAQTLTW